MPKQVGGPGACFIFSRRLSDLEGDTARTRTLATLATRPRKDLNQLRRSVTRLTTLSSDLRKPTAAPCRPCNHKMTSAPNDWADRVDAFLENRREFFEAQAEENV